MRKKVGQGIKYLCQKYGFIVICKTYKVIGHKVKTLPYLKFEVTKDEENLNE
jgi:hypothetical protein